ncbi:MAG: DNA-directed RNA polymerase subunit alpha [bacterium]
MSEHKVLLPSKPKIVREEGFVGVYEIDGLYPGYGHTLGNSLRRIILSSLPGAAITKVKIAGVPHEFSTLNGVKEDIITVLLNLKRVRIEMLTDEPQVATIKISGIKNVTAADIEAGGQIRILNPEQIIATLTDKSAELDVEMTIERGLGYVSKELIQKERVDIGAIVLDANFTPIRRVNYEVENMRVGDRTDFNRIKIFIETDGTVMPKQALEKSISIMIDQLKAIIGFEEPEIESLGEVKKDDYAEKEAFRKEVYEDFLKTRIESLNLSQRTTNALVSANIRTVGGLVRKKEEDILDIEGLGNKGVQEIKKVLGEHGITLK